MRLDTSRNTHVETKESLRAHSHYELTEQDLKLLYTKMGWVMTDSYDSITEMAGTVGLEAANRVLADFKYNTVNRPGVDLIRLSKQERTLVKNLINGLRSDLDRMETEVNNYEEFAALMEKHSAHRINMAQTERKLNGTSHGIDFVEVADEQGSGVRNTAQRVWGSGVFQDGGSNVPIDLLESLERGTENEDVTSSLLDMQTSY